MCHGGCGIDIVLKEEQNVDIGVYTTEMTLEHKKRDGMEAEDESCFWTTRHPHPERIARLWIATNKFWRGYFVIFGHNYDIETEGKGVHEIYFHSESWHPLKKPIPRKQFQGFTYKVPKT